MRRSGSTGLIDSDISHKGLSLQLLGSKLRVPPIAGSIKRSRLDLLSSEIVQKRLTTITAGAGYGKTTFVAQALDSFECLPIWYSLDESDQDMATFLSYLIKGLSVYKPEFGVDTLTHLKSQQNSFRGWKGVLEIFVSELENIFEQRPVFVLDDYHRLKNSQTIDDAFSFLLEHLPLNIHLVIISRQNIPIPLSRLRSMNEVQDVTGEDLVFTVEETRSLFHGLFGVSIEDPIIEKIQDRTGGWVSAMILMFHMIKRNQPKDIDQIMRALQGSDSLIYDYLNENVYTQLSKEIKEFLIKTSLLSRIDTRFTDNLLNIDSSVKILRFLESNHLFTLPTDQTRQEYYYHQLFKEFLNSKLSETYDRKTLNRLHHRISLCPKIEGNWKRLLSTMQPEAFFLMPVEY